MFRFSFDITRACIISFLLICFSSALVVAQVETATLSGQVVDSSGLRIAGASINLIDIDRGTSTAAATDSSGLYRFPSVHPGRYRMQVRASGFRVIDVTGITVNVQDHLEQNFRMAVGSVSESITVNGGPPLINTESPTVSTIIDRQFADNLPLNGRSFQSLIELTPGVVLTASNNADNGQFSVSGQRPSSNYWTVDGVSGNIGSSAGGNPGNGMGGTVGALSVLGGTNSLVSVDALQEFRLQTSTYAPEFGRTPGGQISIVTRSGTNHWHGTLFDYLRNDAFDGNNWFADHAGLPKPLERQNDFGGVLGGPIVRDRTFFFFSYEGLRLRLPRVALTEVPCDGTCAAFGDARTLAVAGMQPFLNAFPRPNGPEVFRTGGDSSGAAEFNASYSNPATLNAFSLRLDHHFRDNLSVFGRYNYSPSKFSIRGGSNGLNMLSVIQPLRIEIQTGTLGATWLINSGANNDLRFNYSRAEGASEYRLDDFGGAAPLTTLPFPSPYNIRNGAFGLFIETLGNSNGGAGGYINVGPAGRNVQRQINVVDNLSLQAGSHNLKFGTDFWRLTPVYDPAAYSQFPIFSSMSSAVAGNSAFAFIDASRSVTPLFRDVAAFAQDTWKPLRRFTLTYGLRWDLELPPSTLTGPSIPAVSGFNLVDFSKLTLAPAGTPPFHTRFGSVAPRFGLIYQLNKNSAKSSVLRGGFGVFYDLVSSETGNLIGGGFPPFGSFTTLVAKAFPYTEAESTPAPIPLTGSVSQLYAYNPIHWNGMLH
jgi:hypothetical protein